MKRFILIYVFYEDIYFIYSMKIHWMNLYESDSMLGFTYADNQDSGFMRYDSS